MKVGEIDAEVHVYWKGRRVDRAVIVFGDKEFDVPLCTEIRRTVRPAGPPSVEIQIIGRLIEHRDELRPPTPEEADRILSEIDRANET